MLSLTDGKRTFKLNYRQANQIELKLNVSSYKYLWKTIGDILYNFSIGKKMNNLLQVTPFQYKTLLQWR